VCRELGSSTPTSTEPIPFIDASADAVACKRGVIATSVAATDDPSDRESLSLRKAFIVLLLRLLPGVARFFFYRLNR